METTIKKTALSGIEETILSLYATGATYDEIQERILAEHYIEMDNRKLGHKMGHIKKKMGCSTQFQMGVIYANETSNKLIESYKEKEEKYSDAEFMRQYERGFKAGRMNRDVIHDKLSLKEGMLWGAGLTTMLWILVFSHLTM